MMMMMKFNCLLTTDWRHCCWYENISGSRSTGSGYWCLNHVVCQNVKAG